MLNKPNPIKQVRLKQGFTTVEKSVEAAGVEHEIGDFSAVFQLFDGARVVVATR